MGDNMALAFIRTVILYVAVMVALRIMGKRQIGELQPSELVITIMLGDLASVPMQETAIPILNGITPIITLVFIEVMISVLILKSRKVRHFISGSPSIVIRDGQIDVKELKKLRLNIDDLIEQLHGKDIISLSDVQIAIVDTNGAVCIVPKASKRPVTPSDMGIIAEEEEIPYTLISDGCIIYENLLKLGRGEGWLLENVKKNSMEVCDVIYAACTRSGKFQIQRR